MYCVYPTAEFSLASFTGSRCGAADWSPPVATQRPGLGQWPSRTTRPWQRRVMILLTWQLAFHISGIFFISIMKDNLLIVANIFYLSPGPGYFHKKIAFLAFKKIGWRYSALLRRTSPIYFQSKFNGLEESCWILRRVPAALRQLTPRPGLHLLPAGLAQHGGQISCEIPPGCRSRGRL